MSRATRPSAAERTAPLFGALVPECECCGELATVLEDGPCDVVEVGRGATPAQIAAAPRRPARWCADCVREHSRWKARQQAGRMRKVSAAPRTKIFAEHRRDAAPAPAGTGSAA